MMNSVLFVALLFAVAVFPAAASPLAQCQKHHYVQTYDGTCNNLANPSWGSARTPFRLVSDTRDHDSDLPNPRTISNRVCKEPWPVPNRRRLSELVTFFGQFIDHTITGTDRSTEDFSIPVPPNDPIFPANGSIKLMRTMKTKESNGDSPTNTLSSYIDLSSIYGITTKEVNDLRTFKKGELKMSGYFLPNRDSKGMYVSGDDRVNENPALTAMHTLFIREHNRIAGEVSQAFPHYTEEEMFQLARKIAVAELQAVTYYGFLPTVLGKRLPKYRGYKDDVLADVSNEFSTVAFRVGHTMINNDQTFISQDGKVTKKSLPAVFFNPKWIATIGIDDTVRGMFRTRCAEIDVKVATSVRDFLVTGKKVHIDLTAVNLQRGRDHGVVSYNDMRKAYGLKPVKWFTQITKYWPVAKKLRDVYGDVDRVEAWMGGVAEDHIRGGSMGPLFTAIWERQFLRLRDGDRFYFEKFRHFKPKVIAKIPTLRKLYWQTNGKHTVMQRIIQDNTLIPKSQVPWNPFYVRQ